MFKGYCCINVKKDESFRYLSHIHSLTAALEFLPQPYCNLGSKSINCSTPEGRKMKNGWNNKALLPELLTNYLLQVEPKPKLLTLLFPPPLSSFGPFTAITANIHRLKWFQRVMTERKKEAPISHRQAGHKSSSWRVAALLQGAFIIGPVWLWYSLCGCE